MPLISAKALAYPIRPGVVRNGHGGGYRALHNSLHPQLRRHRDILVAGVALGVVASCGAACIVNPLGRTLHTEAKEDPNDWSDKPTVVNNDTTPRERFGFSSTFRDSYARNDADYTRPGQQAPPRQTKEHHEFTDQEMSAWRTMVESITAAKDSVTSFDLSKAGEKITEMVIPRWAKVLPGFIRKLQNELSFSPGSLAEEIWREANDPECNPEIIWDARVRISSDLCDEEQDFLRKRKARTAAALADYLGIPKDDVHPEDVPVIAMCGSGGGLRALVAGTASYLSAKEAGLFDCVTYTAGVSGSCWLQALYYSSMGRQSHAQLLTHLKHRLDVHIAYPPAALNLLSSAPTNKFLLSGIVEKIKGVPDADFGIVDVYGLLLASRLLVPKGELGIEDYDLKVSNQRRFTDDGAHPLPIYTAVRHEIPNEQKVDGAIHSPQQDQKADTWFQWFEWTPYEFFSEELGAGIPTWAIGRHFDRGESVWRENGLALPEIRVPLLMGIWGSAFCATLSHYYKEIRPIVRGLAGFGAIDSIVAEKDSDLTKLHPIDPASIPNYVANLKDLLPSSCPESIHEAKHLALMDSGMSNNLPIYPLLRPGRDVDVIVAFDASADVRQDNWISVADGYVKQRGIKGWPVGAGWPSGDEDESQIKRDLESAQAPSEKEANAKIEQAKKSAEEHQPIDKNEKTVKPRDLGYCNVWVGSVEERDSDGEPPIPKAVEEDWEIKRPDAGITLVYFPFLANPKVGGVDPMTSDFMSTWNFVYTNDEIDKVVQLARANFEEGKEQTKRTIRAVWERKRSQRLQREEESAEMRRRARMRKAGRPKEKVYGEQGDHFS